MIQPADLCAPGTGREKSTLDHPLDHLVACHRRIEERLATLERVAPHWLSRREEALEAVRNCFRFFDTNGLWHTEDEELSIFPRLAGRMTAEEESYLAGLARQHDEVEEAYGEVKRAAGGLDGPEYERAVTRLAALYRAHIHSENSQLVAIGTRLLNEGALREIAREMKQRRGLTV